MLNHTYGTLWRYHRSYYIYNMILLCMYNITPCDICDNIIPSWPPNISDTKYILYVYCCCISICIIAGNNIPGSKRDNYNDQKRRPTHVDLRCCTAALLQRGVVGRFPARCAVDSSRRCVCTCMYHATTMIRPWLLVGLYINNIYSCMYVCTTSAEYQVLL